MAYVQIISGKSCLFQEDKWGQQSLQITYPELYSFAKNKVISIAEAWHQQDMTQLLHLLVPNIAYNQMQTLVQELQHIHLGEGQDIWTYSWGSNFSSSRAYKLLVGHSQHDLSNRWIWKLLLSTKAQSILLATSKRYIKYQEYSEEEKYATAIIQLCSL